jgi:hypothetical protein
MTKPLDQVKSELAEQHGYCDKSGATSMLFEHFELGFDAGAAAMQKQLAEAEKVISFYADTETYDLVRSQNPKYEFYCELPDSDIEIDSVNRSGYGGKTARQYFKDKVE